MDNTKPFDIPKSLVWKAWLMVKANKGSAGIDQESIYEFEQDLAKNLYKIWNRMSSVLFLRIYSYTMYSRYG